MALSRECMNLFPLVTSSTHKIQQSEHRERIRVCARKRSLPAAARGLPVMSWTLVREKHLESCFSLQLPLQELFVALMF